MINSPIDLPEKSYQLEQLLILFIAHLKKLLQNI